MNKNIADCAVLQPEYLGFIFYDKSPRNFEGEIPAMSEDIRKVGVFVNENMDTVLKKVNQHRLDIVQLHGEESPAYCNILFNQGMAIWKVFSIGDAFNFKQLDAYRPYVTHFLFDTKGSARGGTGQRFNWDLLKRYPFDTPIVLSGGIALEHTTEIKALIESGLPVEIADVNSRFEIEPGLKNIKLLKKFSDELSC